MSSIDIIEKYFPDLNPVQKQQLSQLRELYEFWNEQINVISRKDIDSLNERHVLHSLAIARIFNFEKGTEILDIGTGGGFPGIPLAIMFPEVNFTLVDSIGKKIKVVQAVAESLNLKNVTAIHSRGEKVKGKFDYVVSRAVTRFARFIPWTNGKIKTKMINHYPNGLIALKGGDLKEELKETKRDFEVFDISEFFEEEFFETKKVVYIKMV